MGFEVNHGAGKCDHSTIAPHADDHVPENPFIPLKLDEALTAKRSAIAGVDTSSPREIALELAILQQCFVDAHERQLRELERLLTTSSVHVHADGCCEPTATY
eukprot:TRINITY_DN24980_c0_g1_i2.p2 TRINITY_DN24980_c0_g1~~TRINITY_DN24980_c0_g1_i2.p2  ORF type:complete len:103 (+),score=21.30 TRINITY_DN24980_c0_g1_i2:83-391(+)